MCMYNMMCIMLLIKNLISFCYQPLITLIYTMFCFIVYLLFDQSIILYNSSALYITTIILGIILFNLIYSNNRQGVCNNMFVFGVLLYSTIFTIILILNRGSSSSLILGGIISLSVFVYLISLIYLIVLLSLLYNIFSMSNYNIYIMCSIDGDNVPEGVVNISPTEKTKKELETESRETELREGGLLEYDKVDNLVNDNFGLSNINQQSTVLSYNDAISIFNNVQPLRLNIYYHNISNIVINSHNHKLEMVCVGSIKLLFKKVLSDNSIYIGVLIKIYNIKTSFYLGDIINSNNINYSILSGLSLDSIRIFNVPHVIVFNKRNVFGFSLCDIIIIPYIKNTSLIYNNINNFEYIHGIAAINYYGYAINNLVGRYSLSNKDINKMIVNRYMNDIMVLNNSSDPVV